MGFLVGAVVFGSTLGSNPGTLALIALAIYAITMSFASMLAGGLKLANFSTLAISIYLASSRLTLLEDGASAAFGAIALAASLSLLWWTYRWFQYQPVAPATIALWTVLLAAVSAVATFTR
ncbi:MAG: hypothetical protein ACSLFI_10675 [Solirubrobacterales bacterium]